MAFLDFLAPPKHKPELPAEKVKKEYTAMRWKVFIGIYLGYAAYYLVRKNLSFAGADMMAQGYLDTSGVGDAMAGLPIAYAVSKFLMGGLSDRSDARKFMTVGLIISALVMIIAGIIPYPKNGAITTAILFVLTCLTGWFSGMGWPPCGRVMSHWFSTNERSFKMSVWNTAHNIGSSGLAWLATIGGGSLLMLLGVSEAEAGWREAFIVPSIAALGVAGLCWWFIRDTPESCGLPPIDKYRNDFSGAKAKKGEEEKIPFKTLFVDYVLKNKMLWLIGIANILVYLVRNGISDWLPIYLQEVHGIAKSVSKNLYAYHMIAAIPGTLIAGWLSSKFFQGRCAPVNVLCMAVTAIGAFIYWQAAPIAQMCGLGDNITPIIILALVITGFAVYGPVAMISIQAIAIVPKNAAGTAAGFMGLLGYLIGDAFLSKIAFGRIVETSGWDLTFIGFFGASIIATVICFLALGKEKKMFEERLAAAQAEQK